MSGKRSRAMFAAAGALAALSLVPTSSAEAHGRPGPRGGRVAVGGFYRFPVFPYYSLAYDPFFGPWPGAYASGPFGIDLNAAAIAGVGAIELNVKPGNAEVWVDGKYVAEARDLDGSPRLLWLPEGVYHVVVYKGGYASFDEKIEIQRGFAKELKVRLEQGESDPPDVKPGRGEKTTSSLPGSRPESR